MNFVDMIDELKDTTSKGEKEEILNYYMLDVDTGGFIKFLLQEAFDPNVLHHVVMKKNNIPPPGQSSLEDRMSEVKRMFTRIRGELSPVKNKFTVWEEMAKLTRRDQEALFGVVNKRLRCGVSIRTINKVHPDLIPVIPIGLAKTYKPEKSHNYSPRSFCSYKLDGQRVFCIRDHENWRKYSRAGDYLGNEITTLDHWDEDLEEYHKTVGMNFLDGEAYRHGMKFEDITRLVKSSVNKKDATPLQYHVFFAGKTLDLNTSSKENSILGVPPNALYESFKKYKHLVGVKQKPIITDESAIYKELNEAVNLGYEGVMLRSTDVTYDFRRSNYLLKVKQSDMMGTLERADAYVEDILYGEFIVREDGKESIEELPVALLVVLKDDPTTKQMKVGTGFSLKDRRLWSEDEFNIIEKVIEVEFQGFGARGKMRFPRYLRTREDL